MTAKRESANRANAAKSTGPKTERGKAASSRNATKHGLTAAGALLPSESADDFAALEAAIASNYIDSPFVSPLVHQLVSAMWRLARLRKIESLALVSYFGGRMSQGVEDPDRRHTFQLKDLPADLETYRTVERQVQYDVDSICDALVNLSRYETTLFGQMTRLINLLDPYAAGHPAREQNTQDPLSLVGGSEVSTTSPRERSGQSAA